MRPLVLARRRPNLSGEQLMRRLVVDVATPSRNGSEKPKPAAAPKPKTSNPRVDGRDMGQRVLDLAAEIDFLMMRDVSELERRSLETGLRILAGRIDRFKGVPT